MQIKQRLLLLSISLGLALSSFANAIETREQRIKLSQWPQYDNGPNIAALPQVKEIFNGFDERPGDQIVIRYPGGSDGIEWAEKMRDWFISFGVPGSYIKLETGSGAPDQLLLILISNS